MNETDARLGGSVASSNWCEACRERGVYCVCDLYDTDRPLNDYDDDEEEDGDLTDDYEEDDE